MIKTILESVQERADRETLHIITERAISSNKISDMFLEADGEVTISEIYSESGEYTEKSTDSELDKLIAKLPEDEDDEDDETFKRIISDDEDISDIEDFI